MAHINRTSRAARLLVSNGQRTLTQMLMTRTIMSENLCLLDNRLLFSQTNTLHDSYTTQDVKRSDYQSPVDRRLQMYRMRSNLSKFGPGLRLSVNRNNLVAEFYDLTKSVIKGDISVESLKESQTFKDLDIQLNYYIDIFSNSQVINLLSSLIKMKFDPSTHLIRLLEHEVKFRVSSLTLGQVMKLIKFYNSMETSYEQKQVTDCLKNQLRTALHSNKTPIRDLIEVYHHLAEQGGQANMLALTEEKLLYRFTDATQDDDDIVSRYLPKHVFYDYVSLCNILIELASVKRRPTPLLKAVSGALAKLPLPQVKTNLETEYPNVSTIINTLDSLVKLSYTNRLLVSKLINDLNEMITLEDLDQTTQCNLLRSISNLKWRSEKLLKLYYDHVKMNIQDPKKVDHNLVSTLIHVTANLNYKPEIDNQIFYHECMQGAREQAIARNSRKWLNYVWSLAVLNVAKDEHFKSVLNDNFLSTIENPINLPKINYADTMKLLNLRAIVSLERLSMVEAIGVSDGILQHKVQRGLPMQKFSAKINEALTSINKSEDPLCFEIQTPFGFVIDCAVNLNENSSITPISEAVLSADLSRLPIEKRDPNFSNSGTKVALIYVLFDETIANHPYEPVGHKKIIARILQNLGYKTVFLQESVLSREKSSADLANNIEEMIRAANGPVDHVGK